MPAPMLAVGQFARERDRADMQGILQPRDTSEAVGERTHDRARGLPMAATAPAQPAQANGRPGSLRDAGLRDSHDRPCPGADSGAAKEHESDGLCQVLPDTRSEARPRPALAADPPAERTCVGSSSNDRGLPPEVEALCALLARANRRVAAERRSTSRKLRVVR